MKRNMLFLAILASVFLSLIFYYYSRSEQTGPKGSLTDREFEKYTLTDIDKIKIKTRGNRLTLKRGQGKSWRVDELNYEAATNTIAGLVLNSHALKVDQELFVDEDEYTQLGLKANSEESVLLEFYKEGKLLRHFIFGKKFWPSHGEANKETRIYGQEHNPRQYILERVGDLKEEVFITTSKIPDLYGNPARWIDPFLLPVDSKCLEVEISAEHHWSFRRDNVSSYFSNEKLDKKIVNALTPALEDVVSIKGISMIYGVLPENKNCSFDKSLHIAFKDVNGLTVKVEISREPIDDNTMANDENKVSTGMIGFQFENIIKRDFLHYAKYSFEYEEPQTKMSRSKLEKSKEVFNRLKKISKGRVFIVNFENIKRVTETLKENSNEV